MFTVRELASLGTSPTVTGSGVANVPTSGAFAVWTLDVDPLVRTWIVSSSAGTMRSVSTTTMISVGSPAHAATKRKPSEANRMPDPTTLPLPLAPDGLWDLFLSQLLSQLRVFLLL